MDAPDDMYLLMDPDLLRRLMQRTGTGSAITVRELAKSAQVHHSTIGFLLTGKRRTTARHTAKAIARRLGVDVLVLWAPVCRSMPAPVGEPAEAVTA
ncbi:helix-turn-helix domain-containing protein [[Kitasatospora] papulosa]|uniref:helix-turn-helix domain-containing protein n=1 Tax=[Kitasatospora] papulosa TaxID=1464011 RepID=UPI003636B5A2